MRTEQRLEGHSYKPKHPGSPRKREEAGGNPSLQPSKGAWPSCTSISHFWLLELRENTFFVVLSYLVCSNLRQQPKKVRQDPSPILSLPLASSLPSPTLVTSTPATLVPLLLLRHASAQPPLQVLFLLPGMPFPKGTLPFLWSLLTFSARLSRSPTPTSNRRWSVPASNLLLYSIFLYESIAVQNTQDRESHLLSISPVSMWALRGWRFYVLSLL